MVVDPWKSRWRAATKRINAADSSALRKSSPTSTGDGYRARDLANSAGSPPTIRSRGSATVRRYTGFDYLATHLAGLGFIAASIEMESLNGPYPNPLLPGTTISYRARVVNAHLERWLWKALNDPIFANHVDLTRVALIGHSRGGEAVVKAYTDGTPAGYYRARRGLAIAD